MHTVTSSILWDMIHGAYPLPTDSMIEDTVAVRPSFEVRSPLDAAEHFLAWIFEIGSAAIGSGADDSTRSERRPPRRGTEDDALDERARAFGKRVARALRKHRDSVGGQNDSSCRAAGRIERILEVVTAGFARQFRAMSALGSRNTGVYPFIAVDARRDGMVEWIVCSAQVRPRGPFFGMKLYPRLGCHPLRPELDPLYSHCAQKGIPITTHCSHGGFPDFLTSFTEFGNPENFRPIFERFPGSRIDFAHFGDRGSDAAQSEAWSRSIVGLMHDFPSAYADLSCYTHDASLSGRCSAATSRCCTSPSPG